MGSATVLITASFDRHVQLAVFWGGGLLSEISFDMTTCSTQEQCGQVEGMVLTLKLILEE